MIYEQPEAYISVHEYTHSQQSYVHKGMQLNTIRQRWTELQSLHDGGLHDQPQTSPCATSLAVTLANPLRKNPSLSISRNCIFMTPKKPLRTRLARLTCRYLVIWTRQLSRGEEECEIIVFMLYQHHLLSSTEDFMRLRKPYEMQSRQQSRQPWF